MDDAPGGGNGSAATATPSAVRRLESPESEALAHLSAVFDDLQYALRCCEHLVSALANPDPALVEALWTGALVAYARCFSSRNKILTAEDIDKLELEGDARGFHDLVLRLRDLYASRHVNPRETYTIGAAQANDGALMGVAVVSAPLPIVEETAVRQLGRVAYGLSGLIDARMQEAQNTVLGKARELSVAELAKLPLVHLNA